MIADINFMKEKFAIFNAQIFSNQLPPPQFKVREARTYRGKFFHHRTRSGDVYTIVLSKSFDIDRPELEDVLILEMIHYHIAYHGIQDTSSHGKQFRSLMRQINTRYGRNIEISHRVAAGQSDPTVVKRYKKCYICVLSTNDRQQLIARVPATRIFEFHRIFSANPSITEEKWYGSFHPAFQYYPASITPKAYLITSEAREALSSIETVEMEFKGKYFQVK